MKINRLFQLLMLAGTVIAAGACKKEASRTTGWEYNNYKNGGFEVSEFTEQITGPGLVFIEGGTFSMGNMQDDVLFEWHNATRRITVPSFYLDETEVRNLDYLEYLHWLNRVFGTDHYEVYNRALPDTLVWRNRLAYNEPLVEYYFRHPAYRTYPVVGVNWKQATEYCKWRTDRVNEAILIQRGILEMDRAQLNNNNFNTEAYLTGQYDAKHKRKLPNLNAANPTEGRIVRMEDGIVLPQYRLPTEAEWEYAAAGLIGNTVAERIVERKVYPWNGSHVRSNSRRNYGTFLDNFKRENGDYMGVAGNLNDGSDIPAPCGSYFPNDYGLYNMAGNVSEWVMDVYRPMSSLDVADRSPFRGNVFTELERTATGAIAPKDSITGRLRQKRVDANQTQTRRNYRESYNINYLDGDWASTLDEWTSKEPTDSSTVKVYAYPKTTLISDQTRVIKGGSWKDPAFFMAPGSRRFLDENQSSDAIGFRCAMTRVGGSIPGR